jgi:hypothetical protein
MDAPYEIFNDKDIRMWATMILPVRNGKTENHYSGGFIRPMEVMCSEQMPVLRGKMERPTIRLVRRIRKCIRDLVLWW